MKWVGGISLSIILMIGAGLLLSQRLEAEGSPVTSWLAGDDTRTLAETSGTLALDMVDAPDVATAGPQPEAQPFNSNDPFVIKRILPINGPIRYGEWHWDDEGVPEGPLVVTVDLQARVISVFRDGYEIGAAAVLLGTQEKPTPVGVFPVLEKKRHNISSIYNVPMPYTMRLTWDGIAIHASDVENGYASRGCVGTPEEFAARLFAIIQRGDRVIITDGQRATIGSSINPGV